MKTTIISAFACALLVWSTAGLSQNDSGTTLNLKDADINSLITTVSDVTGRNFIIDPRVKGKVTVMSSTSMSPDEIYGVFLAILQVHGFAAVPAGAVTKIVPEVGAKQDGGTYFDIETGLPDDEVVTRVVEIQNVPAAQLVPILRPLVPQYGHLAAYSPSNMLIISDRAANVGRLTEIIRRIDQGGDRELEVIPLSHASAAEVQQTVSGLVQSEQKKGGADPSSEPLTILADERTNSILLAGDKSSRLQVRAVIAHLDIPLELDEGDTQVIYLNYANAESLGPILEGYVQSRQGSEAQRRQQAQNAAAAAAAANSAVRIVAEPDTNALIITAPPKLMRGIRNVIAQLDIRRAQVLVEAILAEVSVNKARQLGVDWAVLNDERIAAASILDPSIITAAAGLASGTNPAAAAGLLRTGFNTGGGRVRENGTSFAVLLNALYGDGETNVLSTPSLVTMDNEEAEISVGQEVPFLTGSFSNSGSNAGVVNPFQTIERRDVGITLGITPQITAGNSIQLTIRQEASSISAGAAGAVDLVTNKRTLNTTVMVEDGDVLVLGGLLDDSVQQSEQKVPLLGDIPVIGSLFRSSSVMKSKQNLMLFIRSVILRDPSTANFYTRKKYDAMRGLQSSANRKGVRLMGRDAGPQLFQLEDMLTPPAVSPAADAAGAAPVVQTPASAPTSVAAPAPVAAQQPQSTLLSTEPVLDGDQEQNAPRKKMGRGHLR